jgi:hypothetical protein
LKERQGVIQILRCDPPLYLTRDRGFRTVLHWFSSHGISMPVAIAIIALAIIQLALQIYALVDLIKRSAPTQRKVIFAALIVLAGLLGAIVYLAVVRSSMDEEARGASTEAGAANEDARRRALDQLYGPDKRP